MPISADCTFVLPALSDDCFLSIGSMITKVHFTAPNSGFASVTDLETSGPWADRLSQTDPVTGVPATEPIRTLEVMNMPFAAAEVASVQLEGGRRTNIGLPQYALTFDAHNITSETIAMVQATQQKGDAVYTVWLVTDDKYVYGGKDGLQATIQFNPADNNGVLSLKGTVSFRSFMPDINKYPL